MSVERAAVERWVADYERLWRTEGTDALTEIFTEDATYSVSPWSEPIIGLAGLRELWEVERDSPAETFTMTSEVVAVDGDVAVVRVAVDYTEQRWRDLWVIRFAEDGRCAAFEEWPFAPDQPDGH